MADEAKAKGNAAFAAGNISEAVKHFTEAINFAPTNHVLYSNRSAAYASLNKFSDALADAQKTVALNPDWSKGYSRLGAAHLGLNQRDESIAAYRKGLDIDPDNEALKHGLAEALYSQAAEPRVSSDFPLVDALKGEEMWTRLANSPSTWGYLQQPDFVKKMQDIQDTGIVGAHVMDPRIRDGLTVLWGVKVSAEILNKREKSPDEEEEEPDLELVELSDEEEETKKSAGKGISSEEFAEGYIKKGAAKILMNQYEEALEAYQEVSKYVPENPEVQDGIRRCLEQMNKACLGDALGVLSRPVEVELESEPEPVELSEEEKEIKARKAQAQREKEAGNAAYRKKDFETALVHYMNAIQIDDRDISFLTNRAAVYFEMGKYEDCIYDCEKAVERGKELRSDSKMVARALTRKGNALTKMANCSKNYDAAIEAYQKALTEHHNSETLQKLSDARKAKKELEQQEYLDPQIADEECEKGNQFFKDQKYSDAIQHYTESIKRNPSNPLAYSNRAASYTKLGAFHEGLKDAEKCIELDPKFAKGYVRKGAAQFFMNEYMEALDTYEEGLKHDPEDPELLDDIGRCCEQVNKAFHGAQTQEELKEKQVKAMQDPEIQSILSDPFMRQVLHDCRDKSAADEHFKDPIVKNKFYKLLLAGIVQFG